MDGAIAPSFVRWLATRPPHPSPLEVLVSPVIALAFLCGMIALLTGIGRAIAAVRSAVTSPAAPDPAAAPSTEVGRWLPSLGWGAVALYGLVLASAGMLLTA